MKNYFFILIIFFLSCKNEKTDEMRQLQAIQPIVIPAIKVMQTDSLLQLKNGTWFYADTLFSGTMENYFPTHQLKTAQSFYKGKEEGWYYSYYPDGVKESQRYYHAGEKDSVHTGWWNNGNIRFEYHFKNGVYNGDFKEWYQSGKPLKHIIYQNGTECSGKGWRENGKLFMNYVMKDNRRYGLMNAELCYSLKNENGEFVRSTSDKLK